MELVDPALKKKITLRGVATFLLGPVMLLPMSFVVAGLVGGVLYTPPEMTGKLEHMLFFQGSSDLGGGCLFAGTLALYVYFGITAALYLALRLSETPPCPTFGADVRRALWFLKFHIAAFLIGGMGDIGYDSSVTPNDFRNMFLFVGALYTGSIFLIVVLNRTLKKMAPRLRLAPTLIILWLIVGSDGNTSRAGQLVQSGQDPQPIVRGIRHGLMLAWHHGCDALLGDVGPATHTHYLAIAKYLSNSVLLGLVFYGLYTLGKFLARKSVVRQKPFWSTLGLLILAVFLIICTRHYIHFANERRMLLPLLAEISAALTPADAEAMRADPAMQRRGMNLLKSNALSQSVMDRINRILRPEYFTNQAEVVILIPLPDEWFFFLWQDSASRYADVRKIKTEHTSSKHYDEFHRMLLERRAYTTSFPAYWAWRNPMSSRFLAGNVILDASNQVSAMVVVDKDK
ncbi:MAG: hypothetical protein NTY53_11970 [Kiritimatiellaeota bacterium]|nr:hypothetical protein [Kiritimatiellota bacterium]